MTAIPDTLTELRVPLDSLSAYGRNPRRGDVQEIVRSLRRLGQYRPIVVNRGTLTGKANEVLAGNHTLEAARALNWTEIAATFVDVDADTAARIVLVDNRASDLATNDDAVLAELLAGLPDLDGTGYGPAFLEQLLADLAESNDFGVPTTPSQHEQMAFLLLSDEADTVRDALERADEMGPYPSEDSSAKGRALARICDTFLRDHG